MPAKGDKIHAHNGIEILTEISPEYKSVLTNDALQFIASLARQFNNRVDELLERRVSVQDAFNRGTLPQFLPETEQVRQGEWCIAQLPNELLDRRVEITGPVDRKMIINALNSGANMFMADFEDASSPTWDNMLQGQYNLKDAVRRTISYKDATSGKEYHLNEKTAVLLVRPRGWHLYEKHLKVDGKFVPGGLFDFGLYFFHNAQEALNRGTGPYFYLPKMQHHLEARLWNDAFVFAQKALTIPHGSIKATVLIETLPAAFQMDEILYELREHSAGLNCGRWDYIFSYIKTLRQHADYLVPDRVQVTMEQPFMRAYTQLLIRTCHKREAPAMGGMAAQIPIKNNLEANAIALDKVRMDKEREAKDGHDGTWVAHPALVPIAKEIFDMYMKTPNQISKKRTDVDVTEEDLVRPPEGSRTEDGLRHNISVGVMYLEAWLRGHGCVPFNNLMEDAATAEISRTQVWQWIKHKAQLVDGRTVNRELFAEILEEEMAKICKAVGEKAYEKGCFDEARQLFAKLSTADTLADFLTLPAYEALLAREHKNNYGS